MRRTTRLSRLRADHHDAFAAVPPFAGGRGGSFNPEIRATLDSIWSDHGGAVIDLAASQAVADVETADSAEAVEYTACL
jgi:hypothetical protein